MTDSRNPYFSDVSDDQWTYVAPYLMLMEECAPHLQYPLRELFKDLRYLIRDSSSSEPFGGVSPFTIALTWGLAENLIERREEITVSMPVLGLRPIRSFLCCILKTPKPRSLTGSFLTSASIISSKVSSTMRPASRREIVDKAL